jgi:predicted dienelactone hydrolase
MTSWCGKPLGLIAFLIPLAAHAQEPAVAPREDGRTTPLMVYAPAERLGCAPLALISHGAGGSENGYGYLARALSARGFLAVVMGHSESGLKALGGDVLQEGLRPGLEKLVADPEAERARLLDTGAALRWAERTCAPPFRVLLGHSMGAVTVMLEAGARNRIGLGSPPAGRNRFDAYVALSPEGPGIVFPEDAWNKIRKPMLILTGTRDQALTGGPESRQIPWRDLPGSSRGRCQWMGVIEGATHMNFAGAGPGAARVDALVEEIVSAFLKGARSGKCTLPQERAGLQLQAK